MVLLAKLKLKNHLLTGFYYLCPMEKKKTYKETFNLTERAKERLDIMVAKRNMTKDEVVNFMLTHGDIVPLIEMGQPIPEYLRKKQ